MSAVISGSTSGPGGSSVSGVGTGGRSSSSSPSSYSGSSASHGSSGYFSSGIIYANNARSDYAPYYGDYHSANSTLDYIQRYNNMIVSNANDRYDERFERMLAYNNANYNKALEFSERMSNTAIQRQVKDLIAAGLNPILAVRLGGASYTIPSVPYVNNVANPNYALYDSIAYNAELDYKASEDNISMQERNNIRSNLMSMSIEQLRDTKDRFIASMNNLTSILNTDAKIAADKYMQQIDNEFEAMENAKDRKHQNDIQFWKNITDIVCTSIGGLSNVFSAKERSSSQVFSALLPILLGA